jgi:HK97 family phage major capsid protein
VSTELDRKVEALTASITELAGELKEKADPPGDRIDAIEAERAVKSAQLDELIAEKKDKQIEAKLADLDDRLKAFNQAQARTKAAAILAGVQEQTRSAHVKAVGVYNENNFLKALIERKNGDQDAQEFVKAVLGTSDATGQAIVPNNFVGELVQALTLENIYRGLFKVVPGVQGAGVDIPYNVTAVTAALLQGAYGSNKDVRDFGYASATATLYTIAQIADIGNQLLRQSNGAAEADARDRLAASIGTREAEYVTNGSGSSQPLGIFPAMLAYGDVAAFKTTLSSEPRLVTMARGIAAMESRGVRREKLVLLADPVTYWEIASEGLGTSYAGGWAIDPAGGAAANPAITSAWGVPIRSDPSWPAAQVGTALLLDRTAFTIYTGQGFTIDVSSEAGDRFDKNITGFRAEEEFAFNAEPGVRTGKVQKIIGL